MNEQRAYPILLFRTMEKSGSMCKDNNPDNSFGTRYNTQFTDKLYDTSEMRTQQKHCDI